MRPPTVAGRSLRICHLGKFYPPATGGIETHVQTLARGQVRLGAQVQVICVNHEGGGDDVTWRTLATTPTTESMDCGVRVTRVGRRASLSRLDVCPRLPVELLRMMRAGVDIVHVHAPNPTMFIALAAMPRVGTTVVTHHSDVVKQPVLEAFFMPIERVVHARAKLVLSTSEPYIQGSAPLLRLKGKVRPLPLGLDLRPFLQPSEAAQAYERKLRERHPGPLWLMVGRLVYYKGLEVALDALARTTGTLMLVGKGPLESELRARAQRLGIADRVQWVSYLDNEELVGAYRAATALWFPSVARSEGFGLSQVEAMASGCPVINSFVPHSGVAWVSLDGESGLTVPIKDPTALATAATRIAQDGSLRARLSAGAVARARSEFEDGLMAERSLAFYEEALRAAAA